jgi:hypothetical protein
MGEVEFGERFKGSPIRRTKREGLLRNIAVVKAAHDPTADPDASHG